MAKVILNPMLEQLRGQVGELVFKHYGDKVVVARKPDLSGLKPTAAQTARRNRFREAVVYGKEVLANPARKMVYVAAAQAHGKRIFNLALADFLNPPAVTGVDVARYGGRSGGEIVVEARDDFGVSAVTVIVAGSDGVPVESGPALETTDGRWVYPTTADVPAGTTVRLTITAIDRPGNTAIYEGEVMV